MRPRLPSPALDASTRYRRIQCVLPLPSPQEVMQVVPPTPDTVNAVLESREAIRRVLDGEDPRLIVIAGPCTIHDPDAAVEFADRLAALSIEVSASLLLVMRVHFDKPRASSGWNGLIVDPFLDGSCRVADGLTISRRVLSSLAAAGLPVAVSISEPWVVSYFADLMAWAMLGAVSSESLVFRELASGLPCPVGFKNSLDGSLEGAIHGVAAAARPRQSFGLTEEGRLALFATAGNAHGHLVLRGGTRPNCDPAGLARARQSLAAAGLPVRFVVDCGHANANRDPDSQAATFRDCLVQVAAGDSGIHGLALESHLEGGCQVLPADPTLLRRGVSITDPCLDWETTAALVREAAAVHARALAGR